MTIEPVDLTADVEALLRAADLPVSDLHAGDSLRLFGARADGRLVGLVGIEVHPPVGLLRSLVVAPAHRGRGLGAELVAHAAAQAAARGLEALYLLTTTAADFFAARGYAAVARTDAPPEIAATSQFAGLCPSSSTVMKKRIAPRAVSRRA